MSKEFTSLYPNYDVLKKRDTPSWNDITRAVIDKRLREVPRRRFFSEQQWATLVAACDRVIPQPERAEPVPIAPWIDAHVYEGRGTGTRYASLPPEQECWRRGMDAIEAEAQHRHRRPFDRLDPVEQDLILRAMERNEVEASAWRELPSQDFLRHVLLREIVEIYYAHPAAWSEIGFGGPASPRGYVRLAENRCDPWEAEEHPPTAAQTLAPT
jgi:hypothetical protein